MKISAVLLAGGESRRFGQDKATFLFEGRPLWERQLNILRALGPDQIFVSARTDPPWRPNDTFFVPDEPPSRGPISGLAAVLAATRGSHLLALAIDLPFMTTDRLRSLVSLTTEGCGIIPIASGREQPLAAIYPREAADIFVRRSKEGSDWSLKGVTRELTRMGLIGELAIQPDEWQVFDNLNRPTVSPN
jgi:molybdopterin-guanine dinucleotide biosynthesis protein A